MDQHGELEARWEQAENQVAFRETPLDPEPTIELDFTYSIEDFVQAVQVHLRTRRMLKTLVPLLLLLALQVLLTLLVGDLLFLLIGLPLVLTLLLFVLLVPRWAALRALNDDPAHREAVRLQIDPLGLNYQQTDNRSEIGWGRIRRVVESRDVFLLYLAKSVFVTLPKRIFGDETQLERFRELAGAHHPIERH